MKLFIRIVVLLVICAGARAQATLEPLDRFPKTHLSIFTPDMHKHEFKIWIADTESRREQGLMFVKSLAADQGMLFIFDSPQQVSMWMKNTLIPLDMLFIDTSGHIDSIAANTTPMSEKIISSKGVVISVLELKGGIAKQLGITTQAVIKIEQ